MHYFEAETDHGTIIRAMRQFSDTANFCGRTPSSTQSLPKVLRAPATKPKS